MRRREDARAGVITSVITVWDLEHQTEKCEWGRNFSHSQAVTPSLCANSEGVRDCQVLNRLKELYTHPSIWCTSGRSKESRGGNTVYTLASE